MYVDDQGSMKNLPINRRASSICFQAAQPLQVLGDAFMARYMDNEDDFYRTGSRMQATASYVQPRRLTLVNRSPLPSRFHPGRSAA